MLFPVLLFINMNYAGLGLRACSEILKVFSVEIPTSCSFVKEFIIPTFIEGSTCFERHTAHHHEL
jgi:hypothetical protein